MVLRHGPCELYLNLAGSLLVDIVVIMFLCSDGSSPGENHAGSVSSHHDPLYKAMPIKHTPLAWSSAPVMTTASHSRFVLVRYLYTIITSPSVVVESRLSMPTLECLKGGLRQQGQQHRGSREERSPSRQRSQLRTRQQKKHHQQQS